MRLVNLSSEEERSKSVLRIIAVISLAVIAAILVYAVVDSLANPSNIVGSNLVDSEFPSPNVSPVYFKPITILYIAAALLLYTGLELNKDKLRSLSAPAKTFIKAFSFLVAVVFIYEVGYNFAFWSGQMAAESVRGTLNPDIIANPFPNLENPVNVVFASRLFALFTVAGVYVFYFMTKLESTGKDGFRPS